MATRIRLARGGKKKRPFYRIVVADSRAPRDGSFIERIGSYDPLLAENKVSVDAERARHWLDAGAKPSERVSKLLALQGVEHKLVVVPQPAPAERKPAAKGKAQADDAKAEAPKEAAAKEAAATEDKPKAEAKAAKEEKAEAPKAEEAAEATPENGEDRPAGDDAEPAS